MASDLAFVEYVCGQIENSYSKRYRKMFGEYMVYLDEKPALLICDNTAYIKMLDVLSDKLKNTATAPPYDGAKPHYILDIDDKELFNEVLRAALPFLSVPKPKKKKA